MLLDGLLPLRGSKPAHEPGVIAPSECPLCDPRSDPRETKADVRGSQLLVVFGRAELLIGTGSAYATTNESAGIEILIAFAFATDSIGAHAGGVDTRAGRSVINF